MFEKKIAEQKLKIKEHYIVQNLWKRLPHYLILFFSICALSVLASRILDGRVEHDQYMAFVRNVFSLSITTITFAIPICMRNIFAAYEGYYSTTIRKILMERFPITMLILSSFTTLCLTIMAMCGFTGEILRIPDKFMLPLIVFWGAVCVVYLFVALEKMVHFIVCAPEAVLEKLEFSISQNINLDSEEAYESFRGHLASMNDIASTIVARSTGRDIVIINCLNSFRKIHKEYLIAAIKENDIASRKRYFKACTAILHEMTRIYRESVSSKNERACESILKSYYKMVYDAVDVGADYLYITEILTQVEIFQSYAIPSKIRIIQEQASVDWFFQLMRVLQDVTSNLEYVRICMFRQLSVSLKNITVGDEVNLMNHFMRVSSNSDLEITIEGYSYDWLSLIDYAMLMYLEWLYQSCPFDGEQFAKMFNKYSHPHHPKMRSISCNTIRRLKLLFEEEDKTNAFIKGKRKSDAESIAKLRAELAVERIEEQYEDVEQEELTEIKEALTTGFDVENPKISAGAEAMLGVSYGLSDEKTLSYLTIFSYVQSDQEPGEIVSWDELITAIPAIRPIYENTLAMKEKLESGENPEAKELDAKVALMRMASSARIIR